MPSIRIHVDGGFAVGAARINRGASRTATNRTSTPVRHHHRVAAVDVAGQRFRACSILPETAPRFATTHQ